MLFFRQLLAGVAVLLISAFLPVNVVRAQVVCEGDYTGVDALAQNCAIVTGNLDVASAGALSGGVVFPLLEEVKLNFDVTSNKKGWKDTLTNVTAPKLLRTGDFTVKMNDLLTRLDFPKLINTSVFDLTFNQALLSANFPMLQEVESFRMGSCGNCGPTYLKEVNFPELTTVQTTFRFTGYEKSIDSFEFPKLTSVGTYMELHCPESTHAIALPMLKNVGGELDFRFTSSGRKSFDAPELESIGSMDSRGNYGLVNCSMPKLKTVTSGNFHMYLQQFGTHRLEHIDIRSLDTVKGELWIWSGAMKWLHICSDNTTTKSQKVGRATSGFLNPPDFFDMSVVCCEADGGVECIDRELRPTPPPIMESSSSASDTSASGSTADPGTTAGDGSTDTDTGSSGSTSKVPIPSNASACIEALACTSQSGLDFVTACGAEYCGVGDACTLEAYDTCMKCFNDWCALYGSSTWCPGKPNRNQCDADKFSRAPTISVSSVMLVSAVLLGMSMSR